ncbi:MAG: SGNH/GDSL hydrolase family protein [Verrucomicrobia bacterium]|jgi:lysophospholipase L1-like esterase|nr:SGNH/GDSL hydrolase family protein [Verrucomicrobiota bacterium]
MIPFLRALLLRSFAICLICTVLAPLCLAQVHPLVVSGYDYRRPIFKENTRILFLGDSITDMKWGRNEKDRNHYLGHSYVFLIAARLHTDLPDLELEFFNRGMSGHTVGDLRNRWQKDAIEMTPDVLSILIGVNDVGRAVRSNNEIDLKQWEADYRWILGASRKANPKLKIVMLDPFVLPVGRLHGETAWDSWSGECNKLRSIVKRLAADYQAIHIQTQEIFDKASENVEASHWMWDGVHPLPQGHELIARHWIEAVSRQAGAE